jgi:hypothetical protein
MYIRKFCQSNAPDLFASLPQKRFSEPVQYSFSAKNANYYGNSNSITAGSCPVHSYYAVPSAFVFELAPASAGVQPSAGLLHHLQLLNHHFKAKLAS